MRGIFSQDPGEPRSIHHHVRCDDLSDPSLAGQVTLVAPPAEAEEAFR